MDDEIKNIQFLLVSVIKTAMSFRKVNAEQLAVMCKVSPSYLSQIFNCKKDINFILLAKIQKALNIRFEVKAI